MNRKQMSATRASLLERMNHLGAEVARKGLVGHAIASRQCLLRQVERAEDEIEDRERRREVLLATLIGRGVVPAMEYRTGNHIAQRTQRPVEIGMDERRMRNGERPEDHQRIGRDARDEQDDIGHDAAKHAVDGVETGRRDPVEVLRRMVDGVIFPHRRAMEEAMAEIHDQVSADEEDDRLQPQRQSRERPVPVLVERNQVICRGYTEQQHGADDQEPDAQITRDQRDDETIANIGRQIELAPPRLSRIAGPEMRQSRKYDAEYDRNGQQPDESRAKAVDDRDEPLDHDTQPTPLTDLVLISRSHN